MMETVAVLVRDLAALLLLAALLELLLPSSASSKLIRAVIGLMLLACLLQPLAAARGQEPELKLPAPSAPDQTEAYLEQGAELALSLNGAAEADYAHALSQQMAALAQLAEGVEQARVTVSLDAAGNPAQAELELTLAPGATAEMAIAAQQQVQTLVSGFYLLPPSQISCNIKEGAW